MNLNKKSVEEKNVREAEDRLGGLPDHILHHILSFLPTKYAVRTSVLSTRWEYAWTSISVLDFYDNDHSDDSADSDGWENDREREDECKNKPDLMDFVDRTLLLHDGTKLQKFRLTCKECDAFRLNSWISTVIRQKVEEIFLCIGWMKWPFVFPRSFFTCESMTKLEIGLKFRESGVKIPNSVCMPNLKDLVLNHTSFSCDHATQKVFFSFPSLEFLSIFYCNWVNIKITTICASRLKELVVRDSCYDDCEIKVYAEKLTSFYFFDALVRKYTLCNLSSIGYARIEINEDNIPGVHSSKFLRGISKVKDLSVTSGTIHNLLNGIKSGDLLTFPYLTTLRFTPHRTSHHEQFTRLFHMLPKLESIIFYNTCPLRLKEDDWSFATMPQCLLSHLKSVELRNFSGNENELFLIVFFLKHACVLERMTVVASTLLKADLKQNTEVSRQIRLFPRVSTCCRIEFF